MTDDNTATEETTTDETSEQNGQNAIVVGINHDATSTNDKPDDVIGKPYWLPDWAYSLLMWLCVLVLPALATLIGSLGSIWGWDNSAPTVLTINAVSTFMGVILGVNRAKNS